jgi:hypothetical protein
MFLILAVSFVAGALAGAWTLHETMAVLVGEWRTHSERESPKSSNPPAVAQATSQSTPRTDIEQTPSLSARGSSERSPIPSTSRNEEAKAQRLEWLEGLNAFRTSAGLRPVNENQKLTEGCSKHNRYIVENYDRILKTGGNIGAAAHDESRDKPMLSPEGLIAAKGSDLWSGCFPQSVSEALNGWVAGPFHRPSVLSPGLMSAAFDVYIDADGCWSKCLRLELKPVPATLKPVLFPPAGAMLSLDFDAGEWPSPLTSCPGYSVPAGLPITMQFGWGGTPKVLEHVIRANGAPVQHCYFDGSTYDNADADQKNFGRQILTGSGELVLLPRDPLLPGVTYSVSVKTDRSSYDWSFKILSIK